MGGKGGKGGKGGRGGTINIGKITEDSEEERATAVTISNINGESGEDGKNGEDGEFTIQNIEEKELPNCKYPYTKSKFNQNVQFSVLQPIEDFKDLVIIETNKMTRSPWHERIKEAFKNQFKTKFIRKKAFMKKAITFQSLFHHLNDIMELKRTSQFLNRITNRELELNINKIVNQTMNNHIARRRHILTVDL